MPALFFLFLLYASDIHISGRYQQLEFAIPFLGYFCQGKKQNPKRALLLSSVKVKIHCLFQLSWQEKNMEGTPVCARLERLESPEV